ncbi:hypothetical protein [Spiroplasma ixodetis]|nr:hypothetical protein [Spiroplasma ixodetis]
MNSFNFIVSSTSTCGEKSVNKLYINYYLSRELFMIFFINIWDKFYF